MIAKHISLLLAFFAGSSLLTSVAAVDLNQFNGPNCSGNRRLCSNISPNVCCESTTRVFASGNCAGCTSTDLHFTWLQQGGSYCGRNAAGTNGGGCISGSPNLRGHSWCRICGTRTPSVGRYEATPGASNCTSTVEPDLLEIDGKWFDLKGPVSEEHKEALFNMWADEVPAAKIPGEYLKYETTRPANV